MINFRRFLQRDSGGIFAHWVAARFLSAISLMLLSAAAALAMPAGEYHTHIRQAVKALETVAHSDKSESEAAYFARDEETINSVRTLLPSSQVIDWNGENFNVDNSWLHQDLDKYKADATLARYDLLGRITERLKALDERLIELEAQPSSGGLRNKSEASRKLAEILQRPEYAHQAKPQSALNRLLEKFVEWIKSWFPKRKPMSPGGAGWITWIAQWFVIILALGVLAFVLKMFVPRMLRGRGSKRKSKAKARIVLGERLEPDQSGLDLLNEAEALARRGELRAAIRKAYIALLVELGDRKIISLAQHKTNRDYLRAVRKIEPLYGNVRQLTDSFERHWYGLAQATENDWLAFRSAYKQALR
jgi:hypothetical protein